MFVYITQQVLQPVVQPFASCTFGFTANSSTGIGLVTTYIRVTIVGEVEVAIVVCKGVVMTDRFNLQNASATSVQICCLDPIEVVDADVAPVHNAS